MRGVKFRTPGGPETLNVEDLVDPVASAGEVTIDVVGAGLNRADSLQRRGRYNLPEGASDVFGMEVSGHVAEVGTGVTKCALGDPVVALLASGGYAERVSVDARHVLPVPNGVPVLDAAGIIEVAATLVANLCMAARFRYGERVLIHGASGGVGTMGIQMMKALGAQVAVTGSTPEKLAVAKALGADLVIDYTVDDFAARLVEVGGADIILDTVGGDYLDGNVTALAPHGRIVTIGMQGGREGMLDLSALMKKKASIQGSLLRDRTPTEKADIVAETHRIVWPLIESGSVRIPVDRTFALADVAAAHDYFDSGTHVGKILLDCR